MAAPDLSATQWITSTRSKGKGDCVEVAHLGARVGVRDSKDRGGPVLLVSAAAWRAVLADLPRAMPPAR